MSFFPAWLRAALITLTGLGLLVWLLWRALKKSYDPPALLTRMILTGGLLLAGYFSVDSVASDGSAAGSIGGVLLGLIFGLLLAFVWVPVVVNKVSDAIGSLWTGGSEPPPPQPYYSTADTRVKQGKFREAIYEIQQQLEKFPMDVTGQMKLAEIQMRHLNDLSAAQLTIDRFCSQPGHTPVHLAQALNTLADWHLKAQDPEAARDCLDRIVQLLPNTEFSNSAAQRIAHLASKATLLASHEHRPIQMRQGIRDLGLINPLAVSGRKEPSPEESANELVRQLQDHPLDNEAREKLATLYAEYYQRPDMAIGQLEELIAAPNQAGKDVARWLNTIADLQLKSGADYDTVLHTLHRILEKFAGLAPAELALQRIEHLRLELKGRESGQVVKLGTYEKDLGLKRPRPR